MARSTQWSVPEDPNEFLPWMQKYHAKGWIRPHVPPGAPPLPDRDEEEMLKHMLVTGDGLGPAAKKKALEILLKKERENGEAE